MTDLNAGIVNGSSETRSLRVLIITVADLPEGGGRTSRLKTLAASIEHGSHRAFVLVEHGLTNAPGQEVRGAITRTGISFQYVLQNTSRSFGFSATWMKLRAVYALWRWLAAARRRGELDIILFNNLALYDTLPLTLFAKWKGLPTVQCYEDERMEVVSKESLGLARRLFGINSRLSDYLCPPLADAIIVISEHLRIKYAKLSHGRCKVFIVPTIVDCEDWRGGPEPETDTPRLLYSGTFSEQDEIEAIVEALAILRNRGRRFEALFLGATASHPRVKSLTAQIMNLDLDGCVYIHPFMPLAAVREEIFKANILLCIRRDSIWARSGQATKLSEYLASGRLVIASDVGDNCRYLKDHESALIVSPTASPTELSDTIEQALLSPDLRRRIGMAGRRVAETYFDINKVSLVLDGLLSAVVAAAATNGTTGKPDSGVPHSDLQ